MTRTQGRELLAAVSALLYRRRLTELCGGNMSLRAADEVIMTPTKSAEEHGWRLEPADMIVFSLTGDVIEGDSKKASRESDLHLRLYEECPDVNSVFHLHLVEAIAGQLVPEIAHHWSLASGATSGGAPSSRPLPTGPRGASGGGANSGGASAVASGAADPGGANSSGGASGGRASGDASGGASGAAVPGGANSSGGASGGASGGGANSGGGASGGQASGGVASGGASGGGANSSGGASGGASGGQASGGGASGGGANSGGGASGGDGPSVSVLDAWLQGQTEEHDRELALVIKHLERASGAVVVAPGHGVFTAAPDSATNVRAVEMFRHSLRYRLIARQLGGGKTNA